MFLMDQKEGGGKQVAGMARDDIDQAEFLCFSSGGFFFLEGGINITLV